MGIGSTVKNMLSTDDTAGDRSVGTRGGNNTSKTYEGRESNSVGDRSAPRLPPGTGPGTSGKPAVASELAMQNDLERSMTGQGTSGYGSDAAAAMGGTLAGTHQASSPGNYRTAAHKTSGSGIASDAAAGSGHPNGTAGGDQVATGGQAAPITHARVGDFDSVDKDHRGQGPSRFDTDSDSDLKGSDAMRGTGGTTTYREPTSQALGAGVGRGGVLHEGHGFGHTKHSARDSMPTGKPQEDSNQLHPVLHEKVRHLEIEEVAHVKDRERHIHHIQHHTQPIIVTEELQERFLENVRPVTHVKEVHANKPEDSTLFEDQIYKHRDSLFHAEKERTVVDKGTTVNETIHHHVHHIIQPIIEKETIQKERIRTTVPIRQVTQEAPVIHQSQMHDPVPMENFLQGGGTHKGIPQEEIIRKVLHHGKCIREVDGATQSVDDKSLGGSKNAQGTSTNV